MTEERLQNVFDNVQFNDVQPNNIDAGQLPDKKISPLRFHSKVIVILSLVVLLINAFCVIVYILNTGGGFGQFVNPFAALALFLVAVVLFLPGFVVFYLLNMLGLALEVSAETAEKIAEIEKKIK